MKLFIDIGHPGHVHYFKHLIKVLKKNNHQVIVAARNREVVNVLLETYEIDYFDRGEGKNTVFGKLLYMLKTDIVYLRKLWNNKPDLFVSFSSPYAAQVAMLFGKPHIALNDTEHSDKFHKVFTYPFSASVITPKSYNHDLGRKHVRFKGIIEDIYLSSKQFSPNNAIFKDLGLNNGDQYVLLRFVSWHAHHDIGQSGLDLETKRSLVKLLSSRFHVFISAEGELPEEFKKYQISIAPHKMHDVLAYSSMFIGESGTMASESAYLGVPTVYINSLPLMCYLRLEQDFGILKHFKSNEGVLNYVAQLLDSHALSEFKQKSEEMKSTFIDSSAFLIWFIENYPESARIMKENPDSQDRFK